MLSLGTFQRLRVAKSTDAGAFLTDQSTLDHDLIFLPRRLQSRPCPINELVDVFICHDSDDTIIATMETPDLCVGQFACLEVVAVEKIGAFLDWGLSKDLFLPFAEQTRDIGVGDQVVVYAYVDNSARLAASMRLERNKNIPTVDYEVGQSVKLLIAAKTDLGFKAIIDQQHWGMLFKNEVFQFLRYGQTLEGFIQNVREDGKIDLNLSRTGHAAGADIAPRIIEMLEAKRGFLPLHEKTPPETIYKLFGVSKKKFKIALGGLYKLRRVTIHEDGIRLASLT